MAEEYLTDDEQVEHVKRLVAENWLWVVGGVALGAAFIFGYRYYDGNRNERALRAAAQFDDMASQLEHNERAKSALTAQGLIQNFPGSPYADQAQLTLARLAVDDGKLADAVAPLTQVMNGSKDEELRHIAGCASRACRSVRASRTMRSRRWLRTSRGILRPVFTKCEAMHSLPSKTRKARWPNTRRRSRPERPAA